MAYEGSESAWDNFGKFIHQFQPETKTLIKKLERILIKLYWQNLFLLFNETYIGFHICILLELTLKYIFFTKTWTNSMNNFCLWILVWLIYFSVKWIFFMVLIGSMPIQGMYMDSLYILILNYTLWSVIFSTKVLSSC